MSIISRELDYKDYDVSHGTYEYQQLTPINATNSTVTITPSGGQESIFEIPQRTTNYGKSFLRFDCSCPAYTTGGTAYSTNAFLDGVPHIRQLQFYTRSRTMMVDIPDTNKYMNMILRSNIKDSEMLANDSPTVANAASFANGLAQPLNPCNTTGAGNYRPFNAAQAGGGAGDVAYLEPRYLAMGTGTNAINYLRWQIPLSYFIDTVLGMDLDLKFDSSTYLRIVWAPTNLIYYLTTAINDPYTGAIAAVGGTYNVSISNFYLYTANEVNPVVNQSIDDKISSGMKITIPYIYEYKVNMTGGYNDIQTRYNRGHGKKLKKLHWSPYNNTESSLTAYDRNNLITAGVTAKVTDFYMTVNNQRVHPYTLVCNNGDDYCLQKNQIKGSSILSSNEYLYNFLFTHKFIELNSPLSYPLNPSDYNRDDGLPLDQEQIIDIRTDTVAGSNYNHYIFAVCQRDMTITKDATVIN